MTFSNQRQLYKPVLTNSDNSQSNSDNISNLTGEEIACVSLEILNQLRDYEITETFTPPKMEKDPNNPNRANILYENLQPFEIPSQTNQECCFRMGPDGETLQTIPLKNGSCPDGGYVFAQNCPQTKNEYQELLRNYRTTRIIRVEDAFNVPKLTPSQRQLVCQNPYLSKLYKQSQLLPVSMSAISKDSDGCGD